VLPILSPPTTLFSEIAKKLKELKFPQKNLLADGYSPEGELIGALTGGYNPKCCFSAPTLHEVCDWLREEKGIHVNVLADYSIESKDVGEDYRIDEIVSIDKYELKVVAIGLPENSRGFDTFHEAQSAGIDKALKMLENGQKE